jgi:uncharacterized protein (DUF362 family)
MDRRTFVRNGLKTTAVAGSYLAFGKYARALTLPTSSPATPFDLVAIKGAEPEIMFDKAIEALGGMGAFVKRGQKVVVKPNIGWDVSPERGGNTNPKLVARIIEHCFNAGAKEVVVFDHTCDKWQRCYANSGIEAAAKNAGAKIASGDSEGYYQEVSVPEGKTLKKAKEHELVLGADVFINVPILKNHGGSRMTVAMKNLMGIVWDRGYWHGTDLHQCIADYATYRKPTLNVVDAYYVMKRNGPRGVSVDDVVTMKSQLLSTDMVAIDAAATKLFGLDPKDVRHIELAAEMKAGRMDLEKLNIKRISL